MQFKELGLSAAILKSLDEQDYKTPTPIQAKAIPAIMRGDDVMAAAQTGTGKTAGFTLPILNKLATSESVRVPGAVRALILTPTRELAAQVADSIATYGKHLSVTSAVVFGGVKIGPQMSRLRKGVDVLVATPGRLLDLYQQNALNFKQLEVLVLDEADRMLDMGFIHDIKKIIAVLPRKRQNLLFSATFSNEIRDLAKGLMNNPLEISVSAPNTTVNSVEQWVHPVDKKNKTALLSHLIWEGRWEQVLVFTKTKHGANRLAEYLVRDGMTAVAIHGNKSQGARTRALQDFKNGEMRVLVATDIAARGLDIELLPHVVNFDLPHVAEDYIHRIGRTGRAGASGEAISLVSADEFYQLADIERLIKQKLPRKEVDGFEPKHVVPERNEAPRRAPRQNKAGKPSQRFVKKDQFETKKRDTRFGRDDRFAKDTRRTPRDDRFTRDVPVTAREDRPRSRPMRDKDERAPKKEWSARSDRPARSYSDRAPSRDARPARKEWTPRGEQRAAAPRGDRPTRSYSDRSDRPMRSYSDRDDRPVRDGNRAPERDGRPAKKEWAPRGEKRSEAPRGDRFSKTERVERPARGGRSYNPTRSADRRGPSSGSRSGRDKPSR